MSDLHGVENLDTFAPDLEPMEYDFPIVEVDVDKYREHIRGLDLSAEQEDQLIKATWDLMIAFVDVGFGIHPVQQAINEKRASDLGCGESDEICGKELLSLRNVIQSIIAKSDDLKGAFNESAALAEG